MNFLIISTPRSGSSSLQKSISNYYNLKIIFEPYSPWGVQRKNYKMKNVVVKTIFHQIDNNYFNKLGDIQPDYFEKCFNFYSYLIPKFDKVILLGRENVKEQAESMAALYAGNLYDVKYTYDLRVDITPIMNQLNIEHDYLKKLSEKFNIPFDTYESIYYGNGLKDKEIILDTKIIDVENKLRQFDIKKNLI